MPCGRCLHWLSITRARLFPFENWPDGMMPRNDFSNTSCSTSNPGAGWKASPASGAGICSKKNPSKITMGEVVRHFDGYLAPIACVSVTDYKRCSQESVCRFRRILLRSRNAVAELMDTVTLAAVLQGAPVADAEITGLHGEGI